tara:strand:+ start:28935 stop:29456 length:522 start_codon:yes stop_codon:yes gene_type:complete
MKKLNTALAFTYTRVILSFVILGLLLYDNFMWAVVLFIIAGLTDYFDGYFARKFNQITFFGKMADPSADKLLINLTALGLVIKFGFPLWALGIFLFKDLGMVAMFFYVKLKKLNKYLEVTMISKITTTIQIVSIIIYLIPFTDIYFIKLSVIVIACILTLYTSVDYVKRFMKK